MKKTILSLCMLFLCLTNVSLAQELNFSVTVNSKQVAGTDQRVYEALQEGMVNFLNNRIWTNVKFEDYERLEGAMVVTVKNKSGNTISADLNVVLRRPVFKSNYNTPLFNYIDTTSFSNTSSRNLWILQKTPSHRILHQLSHSMPITVSVFILTLLVLMEVTPSLKQQRLLSPPLKARQNPAGRHSMEIETVIGYSKI